jgi:hypothetical protein
MILKSNFDITDNHALSIAGRHIELHNKFDFVGFNQNVTEIKIKLPFYHMSILNTKEMALVYVLRDNNAEIKLHRKIIIRVTVKLQ